MRSGRPSPVALLERRAELLSRRARTDAEQHDLDDLTRALRDILAGEPAVRRLELEPAGGLAHRLAALEPVNPVHGEADLRDRFDVDRRVFVLEHPALVDRPMNVVWVALRRGLPDGLADVLDPALPPDDPRAADTAVFYSIWNAEPGLAGLGRGLDLLEGALGQLASELPGLSTFVTLSPIPGFRRWAATHEVGLDDRCPAEDLRRACALYLTGLGANGRLLDPVARFHMGNGARLLRVRAGADTSPRGRERAWGLMANYRYGPEDRAANREALAAGSPAIGDDVAGLLRGS